jgi:glycosyltransferase involved in cell wall biosynthesis
VISQNNFERARRLPFCAKKIHLLHNGIAPLTFLPKEEARVQLSGHMRPLPQQNLWIGTVAELTWNKGLHTLIKAAAILKREDKDCIVCIVGEGEERTFLETLITDEDVKDRVHLVGFVPEASKLLKAFDIFTLPSLKEGLPYVLLEAGEAALPVVATKVGGVPDIVGDKVTGLLAKPKNAHDLAEKLKLLIDDEQKRKMFGEALNKRVTTEFSIEQMVQKINDLYLS